jgi:hypothetical protein
MTILLPTRYREIAPILQAWLSQPQLPELEVPVQIRVILLVYIISLSRGCDRKLTAEPPLLY